MPECHNCPYNGKGNPICLTCQGPPETNHKGRTHLSMDAGDGGQTMGEAEAALRPKKPFERAECREMTPEMAAARRVAYEFTSLSAEEFGLVQALMRGQSMAQAAREMGLTKAAVSARVRKLVERHPAFGFLRRDG